MWPIAAAPYWERGVDKTNNPRGSLAFSRLSTVLLYVFGLLAIALFFNFIAPGVDLELEPGSIAVGIPESLMSMVGIFMLCLVGVVTILGWRIWLLVLGPWWRRSYGPR
jgi:hypothetical protein